MVFKITRDQIRAFFITSAALLFTWLIMGHYTRFEVAQDSPEGRVQVNVSFLAPMNHLRAAGHLTVTCSEMPGKNVSYQSCWISRNTLQVVIEEPGYPRGLEYSLDFKKAPALIPPFTVTAHKKVRMKLPPPGNHPGPAGQRSHRGAPDPGLQHPGGPGKLPGPGRHHRPGNLFAAGGRAGPGGAPLRLQPLGAGPHKR